MAGGGSTQAVTGSSQAPARPDEHESVAATATATATATAPTITSMETFDSRPDSALDVEKIKRFGPASSVATSITGVAASRRPSLNGTSVPWNQLSLDDVAPADVQIRHLSVTVDTSPSIFEPSTYPELLREHLKSRSLILKTVDPAAWSKTLLGSVNADLAPGTLTAIIGGSGSGKTTLLNTMAERITGGRLTQQGTVTFNGRPGVRSVRSAYVMQQDVLLPALTARETLQYSADLRLPPSSTSRDRMRVVEEVIMELGLKEAADTRIGTTQHRGLSGGEKRRVSIGVQMLANPSVLFLDEPTTGLDATSAFQLVRTLKSLAAKGRTVITTIHQPRSEIWDLFDNIVILSRGCPVYSGPRRDCLPWFQGLGLELAPFINPAEFLIDMAAIDNRSPELEVESTARVERLKSCWVQESTTRFGPPPATTTLAGDDDNNNKVEGRPNSALSGLARRTKRAADNDTGKHATFARQLRALTDRTFKTTYRDPMGMAASLVQAVVMGLCTGYIFYDLARDQAGIRSREGFLYTTSALEGYLFLVFEVYRLTQDMQTFDREHSEGCSDPLPFLASRRLARLFTEDVPVPFLFAVISYFMAGFDRVAYKFLTYFSVVLLNQYIAVTCAMACVVASRNFAGASLIANLVYTLQSMACGFFIQSNTIAIWLRWLKWLTYTFYVFGALCGNEFRDSFYDCPYPGGESNPDCVSYTGDYILRSLGFPTDWVWRPIVVIVAFVVFFYAISWVGLTFVKKEMTIARARASDKDLSAGKEKMTARSIAEVRTIDVSLDRFGLGLDKISALGLRRRPMKTILHPVTATFHAGTLNVIMGPSGSGKTSLLNAMALRLGNSAGTRYRPTGRLTFNGAVPAAPVVRSVCSYVCQDDDALLPSLTVRETLRFAASLRLPRFMGREEKHARAEEVLLKMGLKDCADNLVGNDLVKGISGGEKRRVTIAVQILTDPRVLLLDEPTSGLDAFTANSIMEVLQGLAQEGRTLVLTIHQARSDLFRRFGNVLLLARGGSPVYSGAAADMLGYFGRRGFECPRHTNPADFALDLITVDLQGETREAESRRTVETLVAAWEDQVALAGLSSEKGDMPDRLEPITEEKSESHRPEGQPQREQQQQQQQEQEQERERGPSLSIAPRRSLHKTHLATPAELGALVRKRAPFASASRLLLRRAFLNLRRQPPLLMARTMQVVGFAIVLAAFFAPLRSDQASVQNRMGFVQQVSSFYFVGMLQNVAVFPAERDVFYREELDGAYGVEAFLAVYTLLELPFEVFSCLVYGCLGDLAVGFPRTPAMYFVTSGACLCVVSCGESVGVMFNALFSGHAGFAVTLVSILLSVANVMAGILSIGMPPLFRALNYLSPARYAVRALAPVSLRGVRFSCSPGEQTAGGRCPVETGGDVLRLYRLDVDPVVNVVALVACAVVYRLLAYGLLKLVRTRWDCRGGRRHLEEDSSGAGADSSS